MKSFLQFLGFGWSKWKTIEERKPMLKDIYNPVTGYMSR